MKFNTKFLYALMAAGLILPTASIQAWPWKWGGSAPLIQKVQEKATEEVKKEASKSAADYAVAGAKVVGKAAGTVALNAAKEVGGYAGTVASKAMERPLATVAVVGTGIWAYRNWDKVKQAYDHAKKVAQVAVPLAGAVVAGKVTMDTYNAYKSLFATQQESANGSVQNNNASKPVSENKVKQAQPVLTQQEVDDWNELYTQFEEAHKQSTAPVTTLPVISGSELHKFENAFNADEQAAQGKAEAEKQVMENAWKNAETDRIKRAQERAQLLQFNKAWDDAQKVNEQKTFNKQEASHVAVQSVVEPRLPELDRQTIHTDLLEQFETPSYSRHEIFAQVARERAAQDEDRRLLEGVGQEAIEDEENLWVAEFAQARLDEAHKEQWTDEFVAQEKSKSEQAPAARQINKHNETAMSRISRLASHLGLTVSRSPENEAARDERAMILANDFRAMANASNPCQTPTRPFNLN